MDISKIELNNSTDKTELLKIIRSLIAFIVIDGKDLITEELYKETYIKKYLYTLSKSMNNKNNFIDMTCIIKLIENDISNLNLKITD